MNHPFFGRDNELSILRKLSKLNKTHFIVCSGRRRIGKSRLIQKWGEDFEEYFEFQGLHPLSAPTEQDQLAHFANRLSLIFKRPKYIFSSWLEALNELSILLPNKKCLVFFDEISWMGHGSQSFTGELKDAWDTLFKKNKKHGKLYLAIAGSVSSWIEDNILNNSNFLGRVSLNLKLEELPLDIIPQFWGKRSISKYDIYKTVSVFGGIPFYLELIDPDDSPEQNIQRLCFSKDGLLKNEYEKIFTDIFMRRSEQYKKIISTLENTSLSLTDISNKLKTEKSGSLSKYLKDLVISGFLSEDISYDLKGLKTKTVKFRIKDNYLRFSLKYIKPNGHFKKLDQLPGWSTILGLQFENMILNHRELIIKKLSLDIGDILSASPYFQKKTTKNLGSCQIDLLIVTRTFQIYICEIKSSPKITSTILLELKDKMKTLKRQKHYTVHQVLIYAGEIISPQVLNSELQLISIEELFS